jgi:predicted nucleic acid-binding protein
MPMMTNKAHDVTSWRFSPQDMILPDANFWINVFGPAATCAQPTWRVRTYSAAFLEMLKSKTGLFIDVLVLSEFVNTLARQEFNANFAHTYGSSRFKDFRNSADFLPTAQIIARESRKILNRCERLDHSFTEWDAPQLLADFETGGEDFNDQLIVETCKKHGLKILTDDGDMTTGGLTILTANMKLLKACPG